MQRRSLIQSLAAVALAGLNPPLWAKAPPTAVEVWKDPSCGCCKDWIDHMQSSGFAVKVHDTGNNAARVRLGMPQKLGSCHTALVGGYVVEGHVPARDVKRLLKERPKALGLAAPGMPVGSPGMEVPGSPEETYDVVLFGPAGQKVYAKYEGTKELGVQH